MNKLLKFSLLLLIIGLLLAFIALASVGFDISALEEMTVESFEISESISAVEISENDLSCDVIIKQHEENFAKLELSYPEKSSMTYTVSDGKLTVKSETEANCFFSLFNFKSPTVILYLPTQKYRSVSVKSGSGEILISGITAKELLVDTISGDVEIDNATVYSTLSISSSSADVSIKNSSTGAFSIDTVSGEIELTDIKAIKDGKIEVTSGDIKMERVTVSSTLTLKSTSGEIEFSHLSASEIYATTTSADVSGTVVGRKNFSTSTSSGDVNIPDSDKDKGIFKIETVSGDIDIEIAD